MNRVTQFILFCGFFLLTSVPLPASEFDEITSVSIQEFRTREPSLTRAERSITVEAFLFNPSEKAAHFDALLVVPEAVQIIKPASKMVDIKPEEGLLVEWTISSKIAQYAQLRLELRNGQELLAVRRLPVRFLEARPVKSQEVIPEPVIPKKTSNILVGVHNCPLWSQENYQLWSQLGKHPERTPALGFYSQENPEVSDWETKWAVEHGIDFFIYCWYRAQQGGAVQTRHESALTEALFKSRFQDKIKIALMWENQSRGKAGVADEKDLLENLFPYWLNVYFKRDNYLIIDKKPVLYIYRPEFLVQDLGGVQQVKTALDKIRKAAQDAGFDGLWLLGEYRGSDPKQLQLFKDLGLDYSFAYCWPISNSPEPYEAIAKQMSSIQKLDRSGILPQSVTVSQAWSGWKDEGSIWKLPPEEFEVLLRSAKAYIESRPEDVLASRTLILDNWNEWSEGHYLAPYTEYGFGYLDAIARVFTDGATADNLLPADIGKGGYDAPYRNWLIEQRKRLKGVFQWDFDRDSAEGWSPMMGIAQFETKNGKLIARSSSPDPALAVTLPLGLRADRFKQIRVRMATKGLNGRDSKVQLFWINEREEDWKESKGATLPLVQNEKMNDYVFDVSENAQWSDTITSLRLDFASLPDVEVQIEQIVLETKSSER